MYSIFKLFRTLVMIFLYFMPLSPLKSQKIATFAHKNSPTRGIILSVMQCAIHWLTSHTYVLTKKKSVTLQYTIHVPLLCSSKISYNSDRTVKLESNCNDVPTKFDTLPSLTLKQILRYRPTLEICLTFFFGCKLCKEVDSLESKALKNVLIPENITLNFHAQTSSNLCHLQTTLKLSCRNCLDFNIIVTERPSIV